MRHLSCGPEINQKALLAVFLSAALSVFLYFSASQYFDLRTSATFAQTTENADRLLEQGNQQFSLGQITEALVSWQAALEIYRKIGNRQGEANALGGLGIAYTNLSQYQQAIDFYQQQLIIVRDINDLSGERAALGNLGIAYDQLGQYQRAIDLFQQALVITREIEDRAAESTVLGNLGGANLNLGQYQQAIDRFEQQLTITREIGNRRGEGRALGNMGIAYRNLGQYQQAIDLFQQSLIIASETENRVGEGAVLGNLGIAYANLGQYQQAIDLFHKRLSIARETGERAREAQALGNLSGAYLELGQNQQAIDFSEQQLEIVREIEDRAGEGRALGNLGIAYADRSQYQKAIELYQQSLAISLEIEDRAGEGRTLGSLGVAYASLGQYQNAISFHQQDLAISREIRDRSSEGNSLHNLGLALANIGELNRAEKRLFEAVDTLESLRVGGLLEDQRISLVDTQRDVFQNLQNVLVTQNKEEAALEVAERGRSRVFLEELAYRFNPESTEQLENVSSPDIDKLKDIAKQQKSTLLQYSVIRDEKLYIWVIQPTGEIDFRQVSLQEQDIDISELVGFTRDSMGISRSVVDWGEGHENVSLGSTQVSKQLQELHKILIDPIADLLPDDPNQSVIFIPQDELFLVPFAALQDEEGRYLIDRHTILTAPSIQVLESTQAQQDRVQQANLQERLIIGDPSMPLLSLLPGEPPLQLDELPGAKQEATDIAILLNTEPILGDEATKENVIQKMADARVIHLATHGILDEFQGLNGGVVLAANGTGEFNDGLLTAAEIAQMELNAELVVLSACNTGQGRITGDGVVGLSRSLILAGVPSVVVSLWAVPDQPTGELMVEFYRQMEETDNKAQALRQAMLNIRDKYPDPIAWAGFTLIGEAE